MFPDLITYNLIAPFFIRVALGAVLVYLGYRRIASREKGIVLFGVLSGIIGLFLIIGFYTQLCALIAALILVIKLGHKIKRRAFLTDGVNYYILLLAMSLSLIFSGAGILAFDLPI